MRHDSCKWTLATTYVPGQSICSLHPIVAACVRETQHVDVVRTLRLGPAASRINVDNTGPCCAHTCSKVICALDHVLNIV